MKKKRKKLIRIEKLSKCGSVGKCQTFRLNEVPHTDIYSYYLQKSNTYMYNKFMEGYTCMTE